MRHSRAALTAAAALLVAVPVTVHAASPADAADGSAATRYGWGTATGGDEFTGTAVDQSRWQLYAGAGNAGAGQRSPGQVSVANGVLTINGTSAGTTGGLNDREHHKYGRWETRMRVPSGDVRYHPVLLLWPETVSWPSGGEIDYSETTAAAKQTSFFLHYSAANQQTYGQTPVDLTQWHDYAVEWTPSAIVGYVDGVEFFRDTDRTHQPPSDMHPSIQLDWFPSGSTATTPSSLQVDWTRYYPL